MRSLLSCLACVCVFSTTSAHAQPRSAFTEYVREGDSLTAALAELTQHGYRIAYSSAVVKSHMRVQTPPTASDIATLLSQLLQPWRLRAIEATDGTWLIVRDDGHKASSQQDTPAVPAVTREPRIDTIDVTASRFSIADHATSSATMLTYQEVQQMPHMGDDAMRVVKAMPGVSGGDITARPNVRGGRRDEVMMVIDGAEIHNGFHFQDDAFLSIVDTNLIDSMTFISGGMTADRADAMSGIVDVRTRQPSPHDQYRHAIGISFIGSFARTSRTFADGRGSWFASARRSYLDLLMEEVQDSDERMTPEYQDAYGAVRYALSDRTSISAHALLGSDELVVTEKDDPSREAGESESSHLWFAVDHAFSEALDSSTLLAWATGDRQRDNFDMRDHVMLGDVFSNTESDYIDIKQDWSWRVDSANAIKWGVSASRHEARYDYRLDSVAIDPFDATRTIELHRDTELDASSEKLGAYAAYRARLFDSLLVEIGGRWDRYSYDRDDSDYERFSPRVNVVFDGGRWGELRAAWGVVHQPQRIDQLQVEDGVTDFFAPEQVRQIVLGYNVRLPKGFDVRAEIYRKEYSDLRPRFENQFDYLRLIAEAEADRIRIDAARARASGLELMIRREARDQWGGWVAYSYSRAEDEAATWIPRSWDQRHTLSLGLGRSGDTWNVYLSALYHSGSPTTAVSVAGATDPAGLPSWFIEPDARNADQLGYFLRFDLRASREVILRSGTLTYYIDIFNLLDRENPCCVDDFHLDVSRPDAPRLHIENNYGFPRLPSFGFQFEF